jgi:PAS domain S-box-containing protein
MKALILLNEEKDKIFTELIIANKELAFQNDEKEKRAAELVIANKELGFQNSEKVKRAAELTIANNRKKASEVRYRRLFETAKDGVIILNAETGEIEDVNPFLIEILGYSKEEFIGKELWEIGLFKDILINKEAFFKLQIGGHIHYENLPLKTKQGRPIWVEFVSNAYVSDGKTVMQCNIRDITERHNAAEKLRQSNKKFQEIVETALEGIMLTDKDSKTTFINKRFTKIFGYSSEEMAKKAISDLIDEDWKIMAKAKHENLLKGIDETFEMVFRTKSDEKIWINASASAIMGANGEYEGGVAMLNDITERKIAEYKLKTEFENRQLLLNSIAEGAYGVDINGICTFVNKSFLKLTGYDNPEELIGKQMHLIIHHSHPDGSNYPASKCKMLSVIRTKEYITVSDEVFWRKDGSFFWVEYRSSPMIIDNEVVGSICSFNDITERKTAELKTRHLTQAMEQSPATIVITDTFGDIEYVNPAFTQTTGYTKAEAIGKNPRILKSGYTSGSEYKNLWQEIKAGDEWRGEFHNKRKNGELYWESALISSLKNEHGDIVNFIAIKEDITRQKLAEIEIRDLDQRLEEKVVARTSELSEANKSLEAFTGMVSHDLRAPVRAVSSFAKIIQDDYAAKMEPKEKELFAYIEDSANRMNVIIEDLLKLARSGSVKLKSEPVNMKRLIEGVWLNISRTTVHHASLELKVLPVVKTDESLMHQVVENLLANAIKYSSKKEKPVVTVWSEQTAGKITFYFKDNGAGFDMKNYDRLFGTFQRLHNRSDFEGTGVGLSLVKRIIEKHGGTVGAEAKVGEGAMFYFTLPVL